MLPNRRLDSDIRSAAIYQGRDIAPESATLAAEGIEQGRYEYGSAWGQGSNILNRIKTFRKKMIGSNSSNVHRDNRLR